MDNLSVRLENCYGIKKLEFDFDLTINAGSKGIYSIYAPNGFMKSSLARTFEDIQFSRDSKDLIFPERQTKREISIDGHELTPENIFVIKPYDESFSSERTSLLLVNEELRKQYEKFLVEIDLAKKSLIAAVRKISGLSLRGSSFETTLCKAFNVDEKSFYDLLIELHAAVESENNKDFIFEGIQHAEIFNEKVLKLLESGDITKELENYIKIYDDLIEASPILTRAFNHQNAENVAKNLKDTGFFKATHTVNLTLPEGKKEISSEDELNQYIEAEEEKVINDPALRKSFDAIDKKLSNAELRKFREFLADNKFLLPELADYKGFEKKLWLSYLKSESQNLNILLTTYKENKVSLEAITNEARQQRTIWEEVVATFNQRFNVPFRLIIENQEDVILQSASPTVSFEFNDGGPPKRVNRTELLNVLSQGERRALYILNLLFEVQVRVQEKVDTLFIVDDIADSFDYKNKYSIVEYLQFVAGHSFFKLIILTHNFDFHRTVCGRLGIYGEKRLFSVKTDEEIVLIREKYQRDVLKYWKSQLENNRKFVIACIPFARNLAEYCGLENEYKKLTSLLHIKPESAQINLNDLQTIYRKVFTDKATMNLLEPHDLVLESISEVSNQLVDEAEEISDLEDKIVLSIAIRLEAEKFMIQKINDYEYVQSIESNQTNELFKRFVNDFGNESESLAILDQVNLMTPENIHLNSFMYEPILDLSANHLYKLYSAVKILNDPNENN